ncbi:histidine phosphatase family protein [Oceanicoccus sp. KOV_DT_Chl]|uniref:histidine phosphatase family protein n=1 Tax=Oceanicoccus sp. KOV_DT_Chl TaxID=1904639 RepID=UPI000C7AE90C|nr:histidine phosphatase family protein [Oceanicoccus sp. KOV_DT_Chl]
MTEITLVRHGQASFNSDNYDQLSPVGEQQAGWLGDYFAERDIQFDRIVIGSQLRHKQTATGISKALASAPEFEIHPGFNEYDFHALVHAFSTQYPEQLNTGYSDRRHFYALLRLALVAWSEDQLSAALPESWQAFTDRIVDAMTFASSERQQKVLVVSSGGPISMIMKQTLALATEQMISLNLQVINASFSRLLKTRRGMQLISFNNIPHLDQPTRTDTITYS